MVLTNKIITLIVLLTVREHGERKYIKSVHIFKQGQSKA